MGIHLGQHAGIVAGVHYHGHRGVILGRGAQHGGAADVDVLDRQGEVAVGARYGLLEGIEVDHHQVDRLDAVLGHHRVVGAAPSQQAAVDLRVQGLHPAVHHLGKAGVVGDLGHRHVVVGEQLGGAAGTENLHAAGVQFTGEVEDAGFVRDAEEGAGDGVHGVTLEVVVRGLVIAHGIHLLERLRLRLG